MTEPSTRTGRPDSSYSSSSVERMAQHPNFARFARAGFVMSGIVHLFIGYLAIRLALGNGGGTADQSGAMAELAATPGGGVALWIGVVAFTLMALWRLTEAVFGKASEPQADSKKSEAVHRIKAAAVAVIYFGFALTAFGFARGRGKSSSGESKSLTARLMENTAGTALLIIGGAVIIGVGGYHVYKGATRRFLKDLKGTPSKLVQRLGTAGYIAKGLAIGAVGALVILAVSQSDPDKASGLDGALKTLGAQPYGATLLVAAGLGIITYGLYNIVMARLAKM
ncbi:DUF1206 domain-containing protein [Nocardia sp. NPDC057668]|uniref:DUF1206 domain-containing protein n=1 Tax=Nocardia sp. NPDC057668 TaxID=3346202 RepID=UPI00367002B9